MIGSLTGTVREVGPDGILLEVGGVGPGPQSLGGVGYRVAVLPDVLAETATGKTLTLLTHLHVREDTLALYGFATREELAFFRMLLDVPGVGPKSAMAVLAISPVEVLVRGISGGDAALLTKVSGIGKKTAERIVVELKTRLEHEHPELAERGATPHAEVVEALTALGYSLGQAREAVRRLPKDVKNIEEGVKLALQTLAQRVTR